MTSPRPARWPVIGSASLTWRLVNSASHTWMLLALLGATMLATSRPAPAADVVLSTQGEYMDAYLVNGSAFPPRVVFIDPDPPFPDDPASPPARVGRHVNGKLCFFPRGFGHNGQFVVADDTY